MCQVTQYKAPPAATGALDAGNELGEGTTLDPRVRGDDERLVFARFSSSPPCVSEKW
jgi:hypothetical protein